MYYLENWLLAGMFCLWNLLSFSQHHDDGHHRFCSLIIGWDNSIIVYFPLTTTELRRKGFSFHNLHFTVNLRRFSLLCELSQIQQVFLWLLRLSFSLLHQREREMLWNFHKIISSDFNWLQTICTRFSRTLRALHRTPFNVKKFSTAHRQ